MERTPFARCLAGLLLVEVSNVIAADAQKLSRLAGEVPCCGEKRHANPSATKPQVVMAVLHLPSTARTQWRGRQPTLTLVGMVRSLYRSQRSGRRRR